MKKLIALSIALAAMSVSLVPAGASTMMAAKAKVKAPAAAATVKCPSCGMPMPSKMTKMMTVPIYLAKSKKTVYCCPMCPSGKKAAAYWKAHHKALSVPM